MRQNMSFGSNGVDRVRSLQKVPTQLRLTNLCINGASSASFCIELHAITKWFETPQNMSFGSNGVDRMRSL
jgi:hypothetical protein